MSARLLREKLRRQPASPFGVSAFDVYEEMAGLWIQDLRHCDLVSACRRRQL